MSNNIKLWDFDEVFECDSYERYSQNAEEPIASGPAAIDAVMDYDNEGLHCEKRWNDKRQLRVLFPQPLTVKTITFIIIYKFIVES